MAHETARTASPAAAPLNAADALGILLLSALFLILSYVRSRNRIFWDDEIMGWLVLKQPSWHAQFHLWNAGFDSSGLWFHVFGRFWIMLFGASELSLREFSALAVAASAAVLWIAARRFYTILPVASSIGFVYFGVQDLLWQLANARSYGLFLLGTASVLYLLLRGEDPNTTRPSPGILLATFAAYALLIGSHTLGMLYAAALLLVQLALDLRSRRLRLPLYLSAAAAFAVAVISRGNIQGTLATGKPSYWTLRPTLHDLLSSELLFSGKYVGAAIACLFLLALAVRARPVRRRVPVYCILLGFLCLDLLFYFVSLKTTSIYVDRYLMPIALAAVLLLCELLTLIREAPAPLPRLHTALPAILLLLAACFLFVPRFNRKHWFPYPDYTHDLLARLPAGIPVIDTDVSSFREVLFYHHDDLDRPFLFPVDWEVALDPHSLGGVSGFHEMDRFKDNNIYAGNIQPTAQILTQTLAQQHSFVVITPQVAPVWLQKRILSNPRYTVQSLGNFQQMPTELSLWLVHD